MWCTESIIHLFSRYPAFVNMMHLYEWWHRIPVSLDIALYYIHPLLCLLFPTAPSFRNRAIRLYCHSPTSLVSPQNVQELVCCIFLLILTCSYNTYQFNFFSRSYYCIFHIVLLLNWNFRQYLPTSDHEQIGWRLQSYRAPIYLENNH